MLRRILGTAWLLLMAAGCPGGGDREPDWTPLGGVIPGGVWAFALDARAHPHVSTYGSLVRLDGDTWLDVPSDGLKAISMLSFDSTGALHARANQGQLWRRPPGASTWERFDDGSGVQIMPVEASDGVLYMGTGVMGTGDMAQIVYREPGASTWSPTGVTYDLAHDSLVADDDGNVWALNQWTTAFRIHRGQSTEFPAACPSVPGSIGRHVLVAATAGTLYCAFLGYVDRNGVIGAYDVATGRSVALNDGSCRGGSVLECHEDYPAEGGYVSQVGRTAAGDFYSIWAQNNGSYPYLLHLRRGSSVWEQAADLGTPWLAGNGGLAFMLRGERVHLYSSQFTGSFNPGDGSVDPGNFFGYVYPPF
ncbi:MAG: hypothetical protein JNL83_39485 [Myxococcales bacterium]|nr:hypothetical protein [Myxococcales bacterium]